MSEVFSNYTGCIVTRSHITGDILCRWPGPECDCMMQRIDEGYKGWTPMPSDIARLYDELDRTTDTYERMRIIDALAAKEA